MTGSSQRWPCHPDRHSFVLCFSGFLFSPYYWLQGEHDSSDRDACWSEQPASRVLWVLRSNWRRQPTTRLISKCHVAIYVMKKVMGLVEVVSKHPCDEITVSSDGWGKRGICHTNTACGCCLSRGNVLGLWKNYRKPEGLKPSGWRREGSREKDHTGLCRLGWDLEKLREAANSV